jgi:hypothetical protein
VVGVEETGSSRPVDELTLVPGVGPVCKHRASMEQLDQLPRNTRKAMCAAASAKVAEFGEFVSAVDAQVSRLNRRQHPSSSALPEHSRPPLRARPSRAQPEWERIIALRLWWVKNGLRVKNGFPMAMLLRGFVEGSLGGEARVAAGRMEARGLLTIRTDRVRLTEALRLTSVDTPQTEQTGVGAYSTGDAVAALVYTEEHK